MRYRTSRSLKAEYLASRSEQSDGDFLIGCRVDRKLASPALSVRQAIASLANVPPEFVRAQDTFDGDLVHFDFWGSLDSIAVILELEKYLEIRISDEIACRIIDPERRPGTTVAEFVRNVLEVVIA